MRWISATAALLFLVLAGIPGYLLAGDCGSGDEFAATRWTKYVELAQKFGCAPADTRNRAAVVTACNNNLLASAQINAGLVRDFNRAKYVQNLVKHPNRLTIAPRDGSVTGLVNKTWVFPELWQDNSVDLKFRKTGGNNRLKVEVCRHQADGRSIPLFEATVEGSAAAGTTVERTISNVRNTFVTVTINGREPTLDKTDYRLHVERPGQGQLRAARRAGARSLTGYADIHTHMMSFFGFGGGFVASSPFMPLHNCNGQHGAVHGIFSSGDFDKAHPLRKQARVNWPHHLDTAHQQMGLNHLKQAYNHGLRLIVMSAVSNEWAAKVLIKGSSKDSDSPLNDMDSIRLQLRAAHAFAAQNPWFQIAHDPWEARRIIAEGKLAVVLGVEISNLFPANQGAWREQLDELYDLGVRQMGLAHETDTAFSGVARHHGLTLRVANYLKNLGLPGVLDPSPLSPQNLTAAFNNFFTQANPVGLKNPGRDMLRKLASQRMLIDIDHISRRARTEALDFARTELGNYPLIFTHTRYDEMMPTFQELSALPGYNVSEKAARAYGGFTGGTHSKGTGEYMATESEIRRVMLSGGIVGLRTGPNAIRTLAGAGIPNTCPASSHGLAQLVAFGNRQVGAAQTIGSDIAAPFVAQLGPRTSLQTANSSGTLACAGYADSGAGPSRNLTAQRTPPRLLAGNNPQSWFRIVTQYRSEGMKHIGMMPALLDDLQVLGADIDPLLRSAENVLRVWERAWDDERQSLDFGEYWAMMEMEPPANFSPALPTRTWAIRQFDRRQSNFRRWTPIVSGVLPKQYVRFADLNGDRKVDAFRRTADGRWLVMLMQSNSTFSNQWVQVSGTQLTPLSRMHLDDFNGDGRADVFRRTAAGVWQVRYSSPKLGVALTQKPKQKLQQASLAGSATFGQWIKAGEDNASQMRNLAFADFNGDGRTDIVRKLPDSQELQVRYMGEKSQFGNWQTIGTTQARISRLRFHDFNGDLKADVLEFPSALGNNPKIRYMGKGQISQGVDSGLPNRPGQMRFADFNADKHTDVFLRREDGAWLMRFKTINARGFSDWRTVGPADRVPVEDLVFADVNSDGAAEVLRLN